MSLPVAITASKPSSFSSVNVILPFNDGSTCSKNFDRYRLIRMKEVPEVEMHFIENELAPTGLGEPTLPPAGGAIANAMKAATGKRVYKQPFMADPNFWKTTAKPIIG